MQCKETGPWAPLNVTLCLAEQMMLIACVTANYKDVVQKVARLTAQQFPYNAQ